MSFTKEVKKLNSLNKIKKHLILQRISTMSELSILSKRNRYFKNFVFLSKKALTLAKRNIDINISFIGKANFNEKKLIILVSSDGYESKDSYDLFDKLYKEGDYVIAFYDAAINYLKRKKIMPILMVHDKEDYSNISPFIFSVFKNKTISSVNFILNSTQLNEDEAFTIMPLGNSEIEYEEDELEYKLDDKSEYAFYPNVLSSLDKILYNYIYSITNYLILEADIFCLSKDLIQYKQSLDIIEDKEAVLNMYMSKSKRLKESSDIIYKLSNHNLKNKGKDE